MAKKDRLSTYDGLQSVSTGGGSGYAVTTDPTKLPPIPGTTGTVGGTLSTYGGQGQRVETGTGGRIAGYDGSGPTVQTVLGQTGGQGQTTPTAATGAGAAPAAPTYAGTYEEQLAQLYDQITGRDPFSYNVNMDPIYQNYKDQYIQGGKRAMQDTMGQAAGLTGGYGSTYSQAAGQQAYDQYLTQLTNKIPELYEMAYGMYKDQGDQLTQQYGMLNDLRATEYNQWRDAMSDYNYDREFAYKQQQDAYSKIMAMIQATGYNPTDAELAAAGMTRRQAEKLREAYKQAQKTGKTGSGGGGGGRGGSGGKKTDLDKDNNKVRDTAQGSQSTSTGGSKESAQEKAYRQWLAEQLRKQRQQQGGGGLTK
jgi:hypothetical protein